ncbi:MAG: arylsulfatase [Verrucomicrobiota bacterium]
MKRLSVILAMVVLGVGWSGAVEEGREGPVNIVYILADDLGYGDLGCYGQEIMQTPRIDEMAAGGLRFTDHYSGSCECAPTRSVLMTGQHTGRTRVRKNGQGPLLPEDVTVAEVLKGAGYTTMGIGKWGIGEEGTTGVPWEQGFDHFFGYLNQTNAHHYYPPFLWKDGEKISYPDNPEKRTHYSHDLMTDEALNFIEENREGPFFLYLAYTLVHVDLDVPEDSKAPYVGVIEETEPYGTPGGQHYRYEEQPHATFAGMTSRLDRDVGRILDLLENLEIAENTLVIFTSDNGPTSAGGADPNFFNGNGDLRVIKFELYEGGIRVPMIAWWPGTVEPGTETDFVSAHWDMFPTFSALAGIDEEELPEGLTGVSILPTIRGEEQPERDYLYWENAGRMGMQAVRMGKWKGWRAGLAKDRDAPLELYDLENDIGEATDVAAANPEVVAEILAVMEEAREAQKPDALFIGRKNKKGK